MLDLFKYYYDFSTKNKYLPDGNKIIILDAEGNIIVSINLLRMLFNELGSLDLSFSSNTPDFQTFDASFTYNELQTKIDIGS